MKHAVDLLRAAARARDQRGDETGRRGERVRRAAARGGTGACCLEDGVALELPLGPAQERPWRRYWITAGDGHGRGGGARRRARHEAKRGWRRTGHEAGGELRRRGERCAGRRAGPRPGSAARARRADVPPLWLAAATASVGEAHAVEPPFLFPPCALHLLLLRSGLGLGLGREGALEQ